MRRLIGVFVIAITLCGIASAEAGAARHDALLRGRILGLVPSLQLGLPLGSGFGNLQYNGGPVEHTNTTYAIYWAPPGFSFASGYTSLIDRYFGDVAAASGSSSNVYYSDTQYSDSSGKIAYRSTFGGSVVDSDPLPASGCSDSDTSVCLSDAQIQAEIENVVARQGWPTGATTEYFLFTAKGVGSCTGSSCAFTDYCAYHSWIGSGSTEILYANMPYADTVPSACDAESHPNGNEADPTISVVSHEHNETITDENGNAWYDLLGNENGDKCAWNFGSSIGSTAYGAYNQLINGDPYELQQEWSNASSGCVLTGT